IVMTTNAGNAVRWACKLRLKQATTWTVSKTLPPVQFSSTRRSQRVSLESKVITRPLDLTKAGPT
ncbi:hypothetical protein EI94DRAFT_1757318, partial [Lactarius quietus]